MPATRTIQDATSLAMHAMVTITEANGRIMTTHAIASQTGVSETHLSKVLQRLHKNGLIHSTRGPRGGFVLAKEPGEIRLLDIYEAIEGPLPNDHCLFHSRSCTRDYCIMGGIMVKINKIIRDHLENTTLAKFIT